VAHAEPSPSGHTAVLVASADGVLPHYLPPDGVRTIRVTATSGTGDVTDPDRAVARRYGLGDTGGFILVRPDGYLAAVSTPDASADIDAYLATITG
jgi:hypothetical protein